MYQKIVSESQSVYGHGIKSGLIVRLTPLLRRDTEFLLEDLGEIR